MRDLDDKTKVMELLNARAEKIVSLQEEIEAAKSVIYNLIHPVWSSPDEKEKWNLFKERALKYAYSKQSPFDRLDSVPTYTC